MNRKPNYISPSAAMPDPNTVDTRRTYIQDAWLAKLETLKKTYNLKIAQPREKFNDTYATVLPSGLPPDEWHLDPKKPTYYEGTKTDTGLQYKMDAIDPNGYVTQAKMAVDLQNNSSPPRQRFVHRSLWQNKNRLGY